MATNHYDIRTGSNATTLGRDLVDLASRISQDFAMLKLHVAAMTQVKDGSVGDATDDETPARLWGIVDDADQLSSTVAMNLYNECSVENLCNSPEDSQVVRENPQPACSLLWPPSARAQSRSQASLVAGDGACDLPTLAVHPMEKPPRHLAPLPGVRRMPLTPWVARDHRRPDCSRVAAPLVVVFGVIGRIRDDTVSLHGSG